MSVVIDLYGQSKNQIKLFLDKFYNVDIDIKDSLKWEKIFDNPFESIDILSAFIDNNDKFQISMWISLDKDFFINVNDNNSDKIIRYLYERYPY